MNEADLTRNERIKLSATVLNNIAVAVIGTGLVAPFFAVLYGLSNLSVEQVRFFGLAAPGWVLMGGGIHYAARLILGEAQDVTSADLQAVAAPIAIVVGPLAALAIVIYWTWWENRDKRTGAG